MKYYYSIKSFLTIIGVSTMKVFSKIFFAVFIVFFLFKGTSFAQDGNILYVQTWEFKMPEGGSWAEFDSLTALVNENVVSKNDKILSQRIVRHLWGSDSRQLIVIREYANIEDLVGEDETGNNLFRAWKTTDEERKSFGEAYGKYFRGHHSDEIYGVIQEASK